MRLDCTSTNVTLWLSNLNVLEQSNKIVYAPEDRLPHSLPYKCEGLGG